MKRTFPVNISGKVFYIDEDAYALLLNYLEQIRASFPGAEGEEIVNDIESRISEHFSERITNGAQTIVYADVNSVIEIMGKPSDFSDCNQEEPRHDTPQTDNTSATQPVEEVPAKRLYRNVKDKVLGGVIGGFATYLGWNANIMRLLYFLFSLLFIQAFCIPPILAYLIAWMVIPAANNPRRELEQQGHPVTIDNIGQNVLSSVPPPYHENASGSVRQVFESTLSLMRKFPMTIIGLTGVVGTFVAMGFFIYYLVALIAYAIFNDVTLLHVLSNNYDSLAGTNIPYLICFFFLTTSLCFILPGLALTWIAASSLFNYRSASKATIIIGIIFETIFIVSSIILNIFMESRLHSFYYNNVLW